jgi:pyruvate/2-oxoglutarate dehydrogenase complex dihydrolipoamide acyltransferase (E2) component
MDCRQKRTFIKEIDNVAILDIPVPQMGEGLQEVIIVAFQKKPGDTVKRDDILYSMETDKAVMEVESPVEGVLKEWLAEEGAILAIGAPIARIETADVVAPAPEAAAPTAGATAATPSVPLIGGRAQTDLIIPPRTRAYCKQLGIPEDEMGRIPALSGKLMPADVDAYVAKKATQLPADGVEVQGEEVEYVEKPLGQQQRVFIYRLKRSAQVVIPAVAKRPVEWGPIRACAEAVKAEGEIQPSSFQTFAYCVVQAIKENPRFRSALIGETTIREYKHANVGIAVGMPDGQLTIAQVNRADTLDFETFVTTAQAQIQKAREGEDQADETCQILLTYMGPYEVYDAVPVLVAPAVAVLFIGAAFEQNGQLLVNLALTFDHRLIQGIEAANFLKSIVEKARQVEQTIQS